MVYLIRVLLLFAAAPLLLADSNSNAVNERIPVRKKEMEVHWNVDCATSWATFTELRRATSKENCTLPSELRRDLQLCAFIYQPPGEPSSHVGPDYLGAISPELEGSAGDISPCSGHAKK